MPVITKDLRVYKESCPYPYNPNAPETTVFRAGDTVCIGALFYNDNLLPAWWIPIYYYFGTKEKLEKIAEHTILGLLPYYSYYDIAKYTIPKDTEEGYYLIGARSVDESETLVKEIYVRAVTQPPPPTIARLDIITEPIGAKVYVDGEYVGKSPVTVDVPEGYHDIKAVLSGYTMKSCSGQKIDDVCRVYTEVGKVTKVTITLTPTPAPPWMTSLYWAIGGLAIGGLMGLASKRGWTEKAMGVVKKWPTRL